MSNLFDVVEICLQEISNGAEVDAVLQRYPDLAEELRPILQASINARRLVGSGPSVQVVQRNREKLLRHVTSLRKEKSRSVVWFPSMRRWAMALAFLVLFLFTGTSLVRASSDSLPGDSLYALKRSWEDFTLAVTFDAHEHEALEVKYENERLDELHGLFASGRTAQVDFAGIVTRENGDGWWISNILVIVSDRSVLPSQPIHTGTAVRVYGTTRGDGIVLAQRIELLPVGVTLPEVEDTEPEIEEKQPQVTTQPIEDNSDSVSEDATPEIEEAETPAVMTTPKAETILGTLTSINEDIWEIDDISVNIRDAQIKGTPVVGAQVKVEGYFGTNGVFVAIQIEIFNTGLDQGNGNSNTNDENSGSNTNNTDHENDNHDSSNDDQSHSGENNGNVSDDENSGGGD